MQTGDLLSPDMIKRVRDLADQSFFAESALARLAREGSDSFTVLSEAGASALLGLEDAIVGLADRTQSISEKIHNLVNGIAQDLLRMFVRQSITAPLAGAFSSLIGGA